MKFKTVKNLRELFSETFVVIIMKDMKIATVVNEEEIQISSMMEGYVVDIDEYFFYLADDEDSPITRAVKQDVVSIIQIAGTEEEEMMVMDYPEEGDIH
jgi:hypothetical protein